ncbi:MAG: adenosylhomocysteinase [Terrimesophilobacter sp.]
MTVQSTVLIETLEEYWWCTAQTFDGSAEAQAAGQTWTGPSLILDDGGDATVVTPQGIRRSS